MSEEKPQLDLERMVELLGDVPTMPAVAAKILRVAGSEDASVADVTRLIATDQGLASKVLGTCNSAYYGLPQRVKTLSRAVALLGFKSVRNLVLVHSLPWKRSTTPTFTDQTIFQHAAATAVGARVLAARVTGVDAEEALLGGLMHDAGRLALNLAIQSEYEPVMKAIYNLEGDSVEIERSALGVDHTRVGELVMQKWSFPEDLVRIARDHHDSAERLEPTTLVVRAADELSHLMGHGVRALGQPPAAMPPALARLGVGLEDLEELEERVSRSMEQSSDIFTL